MMSTDRLDTVRICDFVADVAGDLKRVQVKTSTCFIRDRYHVALATRGGNQSWSGLVKRFSIERCDLLFVVVADGRRWLIPATEVDAGNAIMLGGPKYARFEVEPDEPLPVPRAA